jgi:hypothetical protein
MYDYNRSENYNCNNCKHLACTEVRAAFFSTKCNPKQRSSRWSTFGGRMDLLDRKDASDYCVRELAQEHLEEKEKCKEKAERYVNYVFDRCSKDMAPFESGAQRKVKNISSML